MVVLIVGGAGQVGRHLIASLVEAGHAARPTARRREQADELKVLGAEPSLGRRGEIPREDAARVVAACLEEPATVGTTFEVLSGEDPIGEALRAL